ncbi:MAG: ABC transporter ATP-binding protein [Rhizobiaceae bacterium]
MTASGLSLHIAGVSKRYGAFTALEPTDLDVRAGEFLTLLGPSGSGKTTLLNLIAGYIEPNTGEIRIGDRDVTRLAARHRNIGMVFQNYALFPHMTVSENIGYGLSVRGMPGAESARRIAEMLALMQLGGFADRSIQQLSGGQQQRVALARALVIEPDLLLMDEPLSALDKQLRRQVQLELRRLHLKHGRTTIYVTHDQEEALVLSDRIAVLDHGRIQQLGRADDLYNNPINSFVAGFIGESNLIPVTVKSVSGSQAVVEAEGLRKSFTVEAGPGIEAGGDAELLIRPEHLQVTGEVEKDERCGIPAEIVETAYLGELIQFTLLLQSGRTLTAREVAGRSLGLGAKVRVSWEPGRARVVVKSSTREKENKSNA